MTDKSRPRIDAYRGIGQPAPTTIEGVIAELEVFEMLRRVHNADVAPGQVNVRLADPAYVVAKGNFGHDGAHFARILADEIARLRAENTAQAAALAAGEASDGYHTHNELYDYRMLYNAHAAMGWLADGFHVVKSWYHSDGEPCFGGGWFVVVVELSTGQVTNHYEAKYWDLFTLPVELPPAYDGHTPADAADRLRRALGLDQDGSDAE